MVMELDKIEQLLEKYFEATTNIAEEKVLKAYFSSEAVAPHLNQYKALFMELSKSKREKFERVLPVNKAAKANRWWSIAAAILLFFSVYFVLPKNESLESEYTAEEIASAQEALKLLAFNFDKGIQQISYLEEFEKNTNKFLK